MVKFEVKKLKRPIIWSGVHGLVPHLVDGGLSILQYVDDTILFLENDLVLAKNLKLVLCAFEKLSGF